MRLPSLLLLGAILLSSCNQSTSQGSSGAEALPLPPTEEGSVKGKDDVETDPESDGEVSIESRDVGEEGDAEEVPHSAQERGKAQPVFDEVAPPRFRKAFVEFEKWVKAKGGTVHAALVDLETDKWLLRAAASEAVNPASNAKLITAGAALELLGPAYKFSTELFGRIDDKGHCETLVLRGSGAPDLTTPDLWRLLRVAIGQGLESVGDIAIDQSRFSDDFVPPAFEQQPEEWAPFRAPISALALNRNTISLNVVATQSGKPARIWYDPPGIVAEVGRVKTSKKGTGDRVSWDLSAQKNVQRLESRLGGRLAEGLGRRRYSRRLADPRLAPAYALSALLKEAGISLKGKIRLGKRKKEPRLALWKSEPLAELVRAMGKDSDNFTAEMLLVALSAADNSSNSKKKEAWSSARGAKVIRQWLIDQNAPMDGIVIKNGSGLFDANRLSAELITRVLAGLEDNPRIYQEFMSQLATGATDGTLKKRMRSSELAPRVRAKTGTLRHVDALSGYIQRPGGRSPAAFSLLVVNPKTSHSSVRSKVDKLVLAWVKAL